MKKISLAIFALLSSFAAWQISSAAPMACTMDYSPVCGVDGITYGNQCGADSANVKVAYVGECKIVEDIGTSSGAMMCTMQYDPVCGADGKTYGNSCSANAAGAKIAHSGACPAIAPAPAAVEFSNGNPFKTRLERNRIQRHAIRYISDIATNGEVLGGKFHVVKLSWQPLDPKGPRLLNVVYEDGHNRFEQSFVANISGSKITVLPVVNASREFTLKSGQRAYAIEQKATIELAGLSDSRCPMNARCIWAGEAVLQMRYAQWGKTLEGKNLLEAFGMKLEVKDSDYKTYAKFSLKAQ